MAMTRADATFVDSNVLIHAAVATSPLHRIARKTLDSLRTEGQPWVSRQVPREYLSVLSRPQTFSQPLAVNELISGVRRIEAICQVAEDGPDVYRELLRVIESVHVGGKQIHDANIVATMKAFGTPRLLTENVEDFDRYRDLIEIVALVSTST